MNDAHVSWRDGPIKLDCGVEFAGLADRFRCLGFTDGELRSIMRSTAGGPIDAVVVARRLPAGDPLTTLVHLFICGRWVDRFLLNDALGSGATDLARCGLLELDGDRARSRLAVSPYLDLFLVHDFASKITGRPTPSDFVMAPARSSLVVADLAVRRPVARALDLGAGCGVLALLAAAHAASVIATDINPRALNLAAFAACLNSRNNIEFREGSFFEPVAGERFDFICANLPFVISPEQAYLYRDSSRPGDSLTQELLAATADHLEELGHAAMTGSWHHASDDWPDKPRRWLADSGCDAWVFECVRQDALSHSQAWLREMLLGGDLAEYEARLDSWLNYFQTLGIEHLSWGCFLLRKRAAEFNWIRTESLIDFDHGGPCGDQIDAMFHAVDLLEELTDDLDLIDRNYRVAQCSAIEQRLTPGERGWSTGALRLTRTRGIRICRQVDAIVFDILSGCDGRTRLRDILAAIAARHGLATVDVLIQPAASIVRRLVQDCFLEPVG